MQEHEIAAKWDEEYCRLDISGFIALPGIFAVNSIRVLTSSTTYELPLNCRCSNQGIYAAVELGHGLVCGKTLSQLGATGSTEDLAFLGTARQAISSTTLHITLGYLPNLATKDFYRVEQKMCEILQGWKGDCRLRLHACPCQRFDSEAKRS